MKKRIIAMLLCIISVVSVLTTVSFAASAAADCSYWNYTEPSGPDYAYWNGKRMVKHSGTNFSNVKWMQASLNYCVRERGLNASYLAVDGSFGPASKKATTAFQKKYGLSADGSFGPATIKKMKDVTKPQPTTPNPVNQTEYNLVWPTGSTRITGKYGVHGSTRSNGTRYHSGIDIGASVGSNCYAAADGEVVMCKSSDDASGSIGGRGRYIVIYHANGNFSSLYEHLNSVSVKIGDRVKAGQVIGKTGNSGWASKGTHYAAHLHFGLTNGKMTNTGYDLWTVSGKTYNGKSYTNHTFDPDPAYNASICYTYK